MPGSAFPMLSTDDVSVGNTFVKEITNLDLKSTGTGLEISKLIAQHMAYSGGEASYHRFHPLLNKFHPLHFFSSPDHAIVQENFSCSSFGVNTVGIIRAPRGDGKEAIVMVTPYNSVKISPGEALSLGIAYSVFTLLTRVTWLAKDILWLAADSRHGEYATVSAWLKDCHTPLFGGLAKSHSCHERINLYESKTNPITGTETSDGFLRAGTMAAALVIKVTENSEEVEKAALSIYPEASNGRMPNLDLINIVNYLAVHTQPQGLHVKVEKLWPILDSKWLKGLGEIFEILGKWLEA